MVWLLNRDTSKEQSAADSVSYMNAGAGGISAGGPLVTENTQAAIELKNPERRHDHLGPPLPVHVR